LFFFSSRRRHTRFSRDWSSDVCSSDLVWTGLFMVAAIVLLVQLARDVQWHEVWQVLQRMSNTALLESACLVPVAYVAYSAFDLIGRAYTGHRLGAATTMAVAFVSYAINVNLGAL